MSGLSTGLEASPHGDALPHRTGGDMLYLIWSHKHSAWWGPDRRGYTQDLSRAGRYTAAEAGKITVPAIPCGIQVAVPETVAQRYSTAHIFGIREAT